MLSLYLTQAIYLSLYVLYIEMCISMTGTCFEARGKKRKCQKAKVWHFWEKQCEKILAHSTITNHVSCPRKTRHTILNVQCLKILTTVLIWSCKDVSNKKQNASAFLQSIRDAFRKHNKVRNQNQAFSKFKILSLALEQVSLITEGATQKVSSGYIFSHVRPLYERAVSNLDL